MSEILPDIKTASLAALSKIENTPFLSKDSDRAEIIAQAILADRAGREAEIAALRERAAFAEGVTNRLETELSRVKAERDEAVAAVGRLRGTLEYIKAQSVSKAYASTPAMALNVIRANAEAALDGDFQASVDAARSFLTRMENQKAENAPCGECRLQPGETCDICGRSQP